MRIARPSGSPVLDQETAPEPASSQSSARQPLRRPASGRPSLMGYLVLGLAATGLASAGLNAAPTRAARTGRFLPAADDMPPAPAPGQRHHDERSEVQRKLDRFVTSFTPIPADSRPQKALPAVDDPVECLPFNAQMLSSMVRWRKGVDLRAAADSQLTRIFSLKFGVKDQGRMLDALIRASPTMRQVLHEAKGKNIKIRWGDYSAWLPELRTIELSRKLRLKPKDVVTNPQAVFASVLYLFSDLSHELNHSHWPETHASPAAHRKFADFAHAHLGHIARSEARAVQGQLTIAQELFEATGVVVPVAKTNYRCGELQSIFHSQKLTNEEKVDALSDYMQRMHPAFQSFYTEEAAALWEVALNTRARGQRSGGFDEL